MTGTGRLMSSHEALSSMQDPEERALLNGYNNKRVAYYKGSLVSIQFIGCKTISLTRADLLELNVVRANLWSTVWAQCDVSVGIGVLWFLVITFMSYRCVSWPMRMSTHLLECVSHHKCVSSVTSAPKDPYRWLVHHSIQLLCLSDNCSKPT